MNSGPRTTLARRVLREIVVTLDALLGGDHRQYGHRPPAAAQAPTTPPPKPGDSPARFTFDPFYPDGSPRLFVQGAKDECWEWNGSRLKGHGYGRLTVDGAVVYAHRVAYELFIGPIPKGQQVCHTCDNPPCCNPAHLFAGSASDNQRDAVGKGVVHNPHPKLTLAQVAEIRVLYTGTRGDLRRLAERFGVSVANVWKIVHGQSWKLN